MAGNFINVLGVGFRKALHWRILEWKEGCRCCSFNINMLPFWQSGFLLSSIHSAMVLIGICA